MKFDAALSSDLELASALKLGLHALQASARAKISHVDTRRIAGSIDLDSALRQSEGGENRWDYGVATAVDARSDFVDWVELHDANSTHVQNVIDKATWLRRTLQVRAPNCLKISNRFVWVATGPIAMTRHSPQAKRLSEAGVEFPAKNVLLGKKA